MRNGWNYAPDTGANSGGSGAGNNPSGQSGSNGSQGQGAGDQSQDQGLTFDSWITEQPDNIQDLLEGHTSGLRSALESERAARKDFEKKIRDLSGKAEKGSELEKQLAEIAKANERVQSQAEFYEQAHNHGVKNLKLAFLVATQDELLDNRGQVDFVELKNRYPELFGVSQARAAGNAGVGTNTSNDNKVSMDEFIRRKATR